MNELPEIFRQTHQPMGFRRQGPFYNLRLDTSAQKHTSNSIDKNSSLTKTRLKVNRYSIDKPQRQSRKKIFYNTISYDFLNDPQFYGTRGKQSQIESYNVLIQQRQKGIQILGLKVAGCRGLKEQYQGELKLIQKNYLHYLDCLNEGIKTQITSLKLRLSQLRRQTGGQIKSQKAELKEFNNDLLVFCDQYKRIETQRAKCHQNLQKQL